MTTRQSGGKARRLIERSTATLRPIPSFSIIGGIRCGTTSLINYLDTHPSIAIPSIDELHYYDRHFHRGENWYRSFFPIDPPSRSRVAGGSTPSYLMHTEAPGRMASAQPEMKLILLLRNPVDRAISHFNLRKGKGDEKLAKLSEALADEPNRLEHADLRAGKGNRLDCYFHQGSYVVGLRRWFEHFDRSSFHIISSEELYRDTGRAFAGVLDFLGVESHTPAGFPVHNAAAKTSVDPAIKQELAERYQPLNEELYELIGTDLGW